MFKHRSVVLFSCFFVILLSHLRFYRPTPTSLFYITYSVVRLVRSVLVQSFIHISDSRITSAIPHTYAAFAEWIHGVRGLGNSLQKGYFASFQHILHHLPC